MKFLLGRLFFLPVLVLLTSCSTVSLSPQDKASLKTIALNDQVTMPKGMIYFAHGEQYAIAAPGLLEIMAANSVAGGDVGKIKNLMAKNNIKLEEILVNEISDSLTKSGISIDKNSNAVMSLSVVKYGFLAADAGLSFTDMKPVLLLDGKIVKNGKLIWENSSEIKGFSDLASYSLKDIQNNPEILRQSITQLAKEVSDKLVAELKN